MRKKRLLVIGAAVLLVSAVSAQDTDVAGSEEISLPDVSTVISGGAPKVGKSAVPDYAAVLPKTEGTEIVPQMPDAGSAGFTADSVSVPSVPHEKSVYAEGVAGLGFPGFFTGDFSIYRQSGANPFRITFGHETVNGYAWNALTSGYFDKKTHIDAEKTFSTEKTSLLIRGAYLSMDNGLQDKSDCISDVTKELLKAEVLFDIDFSDSMSLSASMSGDWYKRYGTVVSASDTLEDFEKNLSIFDLNPEVVFSWSVDRLYSDISVSYELAYDVGKALPEHAANRGDFSALFGWKTDFVNVFAGVSAVVGNRLGGSGVVVPFSAGADFTVPVNFSSRDVMISVSGGMDSNLPKISALEEQYTFSAVCALPEETSDWFGAVDVRIPFKDMLTFTFNGEFRTTAFNNGVWQPVYEDSGESFFRYGQYLYRKDSMTQVNTETGVSFRKGIAAFSLNWRAFWCDVPAAVFPHQISGAVSLQDKKARVNFSSVIAFDIGGEADSVPIIDFDCSLKVSDAVRLAVMGNDVVKLVSGTSRLYAGNYIRRSGYAGILAKFFF